MMRYDEQIIAGEADPVLAWNAISPARTTIQHNTMQYNTV